MGDRIKELEDDWNTLEEKNRLSHTEIKELREKLQERATELCLFRDKLAQALGIQISRKKWWDASKAKKDSMLMNKIAALRSKEK